MATTTNYGWTTPDDTALVKDGAAAIRALGTSIDTSMNTALGTKKAGLVLLNTTTFSAVASQSINDVFSSTYDDYLIVLKAVQSTSTGFSFRLRVSGADNSNANYSTAGIVYFSDNATATLGAENATSYNLSGGSTLYGNYQVNALNPFATQYTQFITNGVNSTGGAGFETRSIRTAGTFEATTSFTGFSVITSSGTITGSISVFGVNK